MNALPRLTALSLLTILAAVPSAPPAGATEPPEGVSGEFLLAGDQAGDVAQRLTLDIGSTRWLFRSTASVVAREEVPVAGGYTSRRLEPRSPFTNADHTAGCEAGPLVIGPLALHGLYRRALDPSAGGLTWTALGQDPRVRLDRGLDGTRWSGVAVRVPTPVGDRGRSLRARPGFLWMTNEKTTIQLATLPIGWTLREGAFRGSGVDLGAAAGRSRIVPRKEESWIFETPPFLGDRLAVLGASLGGRIAVAGTGRCALAVAGEAWQQRCGYRPARWSAQGWFSAGVPGLTLDGRLSRTDPGYRHLDGGASSAAAFTGLGVGGRYRSVPFVWSAAWERRQGWDAGAPGAAVEEMRGSVGVARRRGVLRRLDFRGEYEPNDDGSAADRDGEADLFVTARVRLQAGWWWLAAEGGEDIESRRVETGARGALGRRGRTASVTVGWRAAPERLRASLSVPIGQRVRIEGVGQAEAYTDEPIWTGSVRVRVQW